MSVHTRARRWRDWILFGAAYAVILGAILFAYPPGQGTARVDVAANQGASLR